MPRGARRLPKECLRQLGVADLILHAGDFIAADFYRWMLELAPLEAVHGNMDDAELKQLLPARRIVEVEDARIGIVHEPKRSAGFEDCDAVVFGHTHMPHVSHVGGTLLLNPGSPTERRLSPSRSMLLLMVEGKRLTPDFVHLTT